MGAPPLIVDASVLIAILLREPDGDRYAQIMSESDDGLYLSPMNYVEAAIKADKIDEATGSALDEILRAAGIEIVSVSPDQALIARQAYKTYGKGNHKAKLNLGDCFAYALSKARGEPLLFKGDDFRKTDIEAVI
jgi:ribonuclease VapC